MRRAIVVAVSCGSGFSVQFSMFPDALACPLRSQVGMPRLSVVIFFLLESALSFRNPETLCEALLGTCAITRQRFLSPIWHKLSVAHLPKFQARMYSTFLGSNCQIWEISIFRRGNPYHLPKPCHFSWISRHRTGLGCSMTNFHCRGLEKLCFQFSGLVF